MLSLHWSEEKRIGTLRLCGNSPFEEPAEVRRFLCANRRPHGEILYLTDVEKDPGELARVIEMTSNNIAKALGAGSIESPALAPRAVEGDGPSQFPTHSLAVLTHSDEVYYAAFSPMGAE